MNDWRQLHDYSRSRAVVMGTWDYRILRPVPPAEFSLRRMIKTLTDPLCGWPEDRLLTIENEAQPGNLADRLITAFANTEIALFYFVGHGQLDNDGNLCLGLRDTSNEYFRRPFTSLTFPAVRTALLQSNAATKIVILDCCYAGAANEPGKGLGLGARTIANPTEELIDTAYGTGAYTMVATSPGGKAWYETNPHVAEPQTYFTKYIADLIENGITAEPAELKLHTIFRAVREKLVDDKRPVPESRAVDGARDFIFAHNAAPLESQFDPALELTRKQDEISQLQSLIAEKEARIRAADLERQQMMQTIGDLRAMTLRERELQGEARALKDLAADKPGDGAGKSGKTQKPPFGRKMPGPRPESAPRQTLTAGYAVRSTSVADPSGQTANGATVPVTAQKATQQPTAKKDPRTAQKAKNLQAKKPLASAPAQPAPSGAAATASASPTAGALSAGSAASGVAELSPKPAESGPAPDTSPSRHDSRRGGADSRQGRERVFLARPIAGGVAVVAVILTVTGIWLFGLDSHRVISTDPVSLNSRLQHYGGTTVAGKWRLYGDHGSSLTNRLVISNTGGTPLTIQLREPVPLALLTRIGSAKFTGLVPMIIDHGHGLVWDLHIPAGNHEAVSYSLSVPGSGISQTRLKRLVTKLSNVQPGPVHMPAPKVKLESLTISPASLTMEPNQSRRLTVRGSLSDGKPATPSYLQGLKWSSGDNREATVNRFGKISAIASGKVKIFARVGGVETSITVTILKAPNSGNSGQTGSGYTPPPNSVVNTPPNSPSHSSKSSVPTHGPTTITPSPI